MGLISSLGGLVGFAMGGPAGAAIGSGIGSLGEGGDLKDAFQSAAMGFVGGGAGLCAAVAVVHASLSASAFSNHGDAK